MEPTTQADINTSPITPMEGGQKKTSQMVMIVVVAIIVIVGIIYLFASGDAADTMSPNDTAMTTTEVQPVTNTSDDISSIEADLNASVSGLDDQNF